MNSIKFLFVLAISLFTTSLFAEEIYLKNTSTSKEKRFFISLDNIDQGHELRHYSQEKGNYQTLESSNEFSTKEEAVAYLQNHFQDYQQVQVLPEWPVRTEEKLSSVVKSIFNRNRNEIIWQAKNSWNDEWERRYGEWLKNEVDTDFFLRYKIATDCADAVIGLRWIFARIHSLPAANHIATTGSLFGNYSMKKEWRKLSTAANWYDDALFKTALEYIMNMTSTRTIIHDGFHVKLDRTGLIPGVFIVTQNNGSGHVKFISETNYDEITELPLYTLSSTTPRQLRSLAKEVLLEQDWPEKGTKEIMAFRWPTNRNGRWELEAVNARREYSDEQFSAELKSNFPIFIQYVLSQVKGDYEPLKLIDLGIKDILKYVNERKAIVENGHAACQRTDCREGTRAFDDWSTPSRDSKLAKKYSDVDKLVEEFESILPGLFDRWVLAQRSATFKIGDKELNLASLRFILDNNFHSSNPQDSIERRWGLNSETLFNGWLSKVEALLDKRNGPISREDNECLESDCHPKTVRWMALSTYHEDKELNEIYAQAKTYCELVDQTYCFENKGARQTLKTFSGIEKTLGEWFDLIPLFHSDARVGAARRWGVIEQNIRAVILPYYDFITVAENELALLDSRTLFSLKENKSLYKASLDHRLFLTKEGELYKIDDEKGALFQLVKNEWQQIEDSESVLKLELERKATFEEVNGTVLVRKITTSENHILVIKNGVVETKLSSSLDIKNDKGIYLAIQSDENASFYDPANEVEFDLTFKRTREFFSTHHLRVVNYTYPELLLEYKDKDQDLYYGLHYNVETKEFQRLAPEISEKYLILWSDLKSKKAIIQAKFTAEFPQIKTISWLGEGKFVIKDLANQINGVSVVGEDVYVLSMAGSVWEHNSLKSVIKWDSKGEVQALSLGQGIPQFIENNQLYFSSETKGGFIDLNNMKTYVAPKNLFDSKASCQVQSINENFTGYRFNTLYGDYSCMGGIFVQGLVEENSKEIVPDFSTYSWINSNYLVDMRWQKGFGKNLVSKGSLIGIGKNLSIWVNATE